jgi:hypothetical protein
MHIIDDVSSDNSCNIIRDKISSDNRFSCIQNIQKKYKLKNFDDIISDTNLIKDDDIIVELDGDDWLSHRNVLDIIQHIYNSNKNLLIANGRFIFDNGNWGFSDYTNISEMRQSQFCFSHLRTWKASLWRKVDKRYFVDPDSKDGSYFKITADMAYSFPMLEIAGQDRYIHIPQILLVYNNSNPHNDHKIGSASGGQREQQLTELKIRKLFYA